MAHTLLLMDDSQTVRKAAALVVAKDPAFRIAFEHTPDLRPDLVILAHHANGQNGYELCADLRKDPSLAKTPFMMLCAASTQLDAPKGASLGIVGVLQKPFSSDEFLSAVREALTTTTAKAAPTLSLEPPPLSAATSLPIEALTRQKIEEIVWEIVPKMAESIIREEIQRLLRP